jgi:hypothetical protein
MSRRSQKCRDSASGLPGGLSVMSFVDTKEGDCLVEAAEESHHVVKFRNRTLLRFEIDVSAECESEHIHYDSLSSLWSQRVEISHRPDPGGARERTIKRRLSCDGTSEDESIKMTVRYNVIGFKCAGTSTLQLQLDTKQDK